MTSENSADRHSARTPSSRIKAWAAFFLCVFAVWSFMFYVGPWIRDSIPIMKELTRIAEEKDIDTTAFFYSENKEFYEGERYLRETLDLKQPEGYGWNPPFFLGIGLCILILAVGFYFMSGGSRRSKDLNANERNGIDQ